MRLEGPIVRLRVHDGRVAKATPDAWANTLLQRLGIRPSPGATRALIGWARAEGGHWKNDARFNPLNTTQPEPGAGNTGSQGNIKVYRSWDQGLNATVQTLRNGRYGPILAALRSGHAGAVADAIGRSPWGTNAALIRATIGSASPGGPGTLHAGGGAGGGLGGYVGSVTVPGASGTTSTPAGSDGALALVQALSQQQRPQVQSAPLAAPAFSAAPVLPAGYQAPQSGGVSTPAVDTAALLSAIRTQGGDTPGQAAGSSITVSGSSSTGGATGAGRMSSKGLASFDGKPVRQDFAAQLAWARKHGWTGTVTSGFRTKAQQIAAAKSYGLQHYGPAGPLGSNHVYGHRGAVDVTDPGRLNAILDRYPGKRTLIWAGPIIGDKPHFSPTGH